MRNKPPSIRAVTAKSALRRTVVMHEESKQIAELQSSHARQSGKRAPKKVCAVDHAARGGQRKEKEGYREQRVH